MFIPSRSTLLHLRLPFSIFLLPVFLFAISQAPQVITYKAWVAFFAWHFFVYPASNAFNSYFDKDEGSIALMEVSPPVDKSLYYFSLILDGIAMLLAVLVSVEFLLAVIIYGIISKLYSHPKVRLKKYPFISFFIVFFFQGAFVYWTSYTAISGQSIFSIFYIYGYAESLSFILAGLICSFLIGANYPLTQIYQHEEDSQRRDNTLSLVLGVRGSFVFAAVLFSITLILMYVYWNDLGKVNNFYFFLLFSAPVLISFFNWAVRVWHDDKEANYKNMSRMTWVSGIMMLLYFALLMFI